MAEIEESGAALTTPHTTAPLLTTIAVVASDMASVEQKFGRVLFERQREMLKMLGADEKKKEEEVKEGAAVGGAAAAAATLPIHPPQQWRRKERRT